MALIRTPPILNTDHAQISPNHGGTLIDDPDSPWLVWVRTEPRNGRNQITELHIQARPGRPGITTTGLARLPAAHLLHAAATAAHPNETYYRMLARPKTPGNPAWPDDHWHRVLQVYQWAVDTQRPGGGRQAVADLWCVTVHPTVTRWLRRAHTTHPTTDTITP